jgi:predicted phosphoribosyltransferase
MFKDRLEAGALLAVKLKKYRHDPGVVLAVPRGGIPVAYAVARELGFPMDVVLTKKIGHPLNKEYAIGAVSLSDYFIMPHEKVSAAYIEQEVSRIRKRLKEMHTLFMGDRAPEDLHGKTVIIIDDGIATGNTLLGTIQLIRKGRPAKIVIAVPVASRTAVQKLSHEVNEVISLEVPEEFYGVGAFYEDFTQVTNEEALHYLDKWKALRKAG